VGHDVVIYVASSGTAGHYDRSHGRAGGAERQMTLLARALVEQRLRVAHVTYEPRDPVPLSYPLTLVYREPYGGDRRVIGSLLEAAAIWRAISRASARVVVVRSASPALGVAALYCRTRRRRLIFSGSNVSDFTMETMPGRLDRALYRAGIRLADAVVVQSDDQVALARRAFPRIRRLVMIPSLAEPAREHDRHADAEPEAFLWFGRAVEQKRPLLYVELARAVPAARFLMIPVPDGHDPRLLDELRTAASQLANLELLEPLPYAELQRLVSGAVAVVNTSYLEGMPNAFLEAWALGVPVLTFEFDPDGVVEREGLGISAAGRWPRFVRGAEELWSARGDRTDLTRRTREHVARAHSPESVAARWSQLVRELDDHVSPVRVAERAADAAP